MIEFSQPNTHKGFHVGHLRNAALGDSLCRIFRYNGYEVVAANYFGDVGTHIAKCLWYYLNHCDESPPDELRGEWLGELYTKSVQLLETLEGEEAHQAQTEISNLLRRMEEKDPELSKVWEETKQWSMDDFKEIYSWLDIHFNHDFYESDVDEEGRQMVLEGRKKRQPLFVRREPSGLILKQRILVFLCCSNPTAIAFTRPKTWHWHDASSTNFRWTVRYMWSVPNRPCTSNRFLRH